MCKEFEQTFSAYKSCMCFVRFIPKYLILGGAKVNVIALKILVFSCLLPGEAGLKSF